MPSIIDLSATARSSRSPPAALAVVGFAVLLAAGGLTACSRNDHAAGDAEFTGSASCGQCHAPQFAAWSASQHSVAMQVASDSTVLGDFGGAELLAAGVRTTFSRTGEGFVVHTEDAGGTPRDYTVRYTFGVYPLQQYLVEMQDDRLQPLPIAWDARPAAEGGQRWYLLGPMLGVDAGDAHWTGNQLAWNYVCADCHSTGVRKGYDASLGAYGTRWSDLSVGCEACHGPGSAHERWARASGIVRRLAWRDNGLRSHLSGGSAAWQIDPATGSARPHATPTADAEVAVCAQCHTRRTHIADGYTAGAELHDFYDPLPIVRGLFFPDGQQREEVYTVGSFQQSTMYAAGVRCADCHDPHTQKLRAPGNQVCARCHLSSKFDTPDHHFHNQGSAGARCASCHMPDTTYMQIDLRHDHSIRIPRPDLSVSLGVPNACTRCHVDRDAAWAASELRRRYPDPLPGFQRFAEVFAADDARMPEAPRGLAAVAADSTQPFVIRAAALTRLARYPSDESMAVARSAMDHPRPEVRRAALQALEAFPPEERAIAAPLLRDRTRAVRQGAAWLLAPLFGELSPEQQRDYDAARSDFVQSHRYNSDRAASRLTLGAYYVQLGQLDSALAEFHAAVRLTPRNAVAHANIAGVFALQGKTAEAIVEAERALALDPWDGATLSLLEMLKAR